MQSVPIGGCVRDNTRAHGHQSQFSEYFNHYKTLIVRLPIDLSCQNQHFQHANIKLCMWCERTKFKTHISQNTLNQCYGKYVESKQLNDFKPPKAIKTFYDLLRKLAKDLDVKIARSESFRCSTNNTNDVVNDMVVFTWKHESNKQINLSALETLYQKAMLHFYQEEFHRYLVFDTNLSCSSNLEGGEEDSANRDQGSVCSTMTIEIDPVQVDMSQSPTHFESSHPTMRFGMTQRSPQLEASMPSNQSNSNFRSSLEISSGQMFFDFIVSGLDHINDEQLREQAKCEIQKILTDLLAQDIINEITENKNK